MTPMRTILLIAEREVRQRLRSKLFVVSTLLIAAIVTALAFVPALTGAFAGDDDDAPAEPGDPVVIAVVGDLSSAAREALEVTLGPVDLRPVDDEAAAESTLLDDEAALAVVDGDRVLAPPGGGFFNLSGGRAARAAATLGTVAALEAADAAGAVADVLAAAPLEVTTVGEQDPADTAARMVVANLGVVFLFGVLIMYASMIINGVIEEKGSRVVELLVAVVPVPQLMTGKLLGLGIVGLGQTLTIFAPPTIVLLVTAREHVPPGVGALSGLIAIWFVLGYALYAVMAAGLGSLVSRPEEAQAVLTPANLLMISGYFLGFAAIQAPDALYARVAAMVPFSAPYAMLVRQAIGSPSLVEVVASMALLVLTTIGFTFLAARIYRGGILRTGARVKLGEAWRGATR